MNESNQYTKESESFSFVFFFWFIIELFIGIPMYLFALSLFPFSDKTFSFTETLIFQILFSIVSIPVSAIFLLSALPFSPIDFSFKAIRNSFFHKLIFVLTLPIFLLEIVVIELIKNSFPSLSKNGMIWVIFIALSIIFIFIWIILSLLIWEVLKGKNSSQFLRIYRTRQKSNYFNQYYLKTTLLNETIKFQGINSKRRWVVLMISVPLLILFSTDFISIYYGNFLSQSLFIFSFDLFCFLFAVPMYIEILSQKGYDFTSITKINNKLFGFYDISQNFTVYGVSLIVFFIIVNELSYNIEKDQFSSLSFLITFLIDLIILLIVLFSNQIKDLFKKRPRPRGEKDWDYYE